MKFKIETDTLRGLLIHASIIVGLVLLLLFTFFFGILPIVTNKDEVVSVPDLRGMTLDEASRFVSNRHLALEVRDSAYNSEVKPFTVLDQYPHPSTKVKVNRKISLRLNAKIAPTVSYPDLTGTTFDFAQAQLKSLDLEIGTVKYRVDIAHNAILESSIQGKRILAGERVSKGSRVDLVIGHLQNKFPLPDFSNMPLDEAIALINGMSLELKEIHDPPGDGEELYTVQTQHPNPGDTVRVGDEIELWIIKKDE